MYKIDSGLNQYCIVGHILKIKALIATAILFFNVACAQRSINALGKKDLECVARLGNIRTHNIQYKEFKAQQGITAFIRINASHWEPISINKFSLIVLRDTSIVFKYDNRGGKFEDSVKSALQKVQSNDSILFFRIYAKLPNGSDILLNPLEFKIE